MTPTILLLTAFLLVEAQPAKTESRQSSQDNPRRTGFDASAFKPIDADIINSASYLAAHPDQRFRLLGIDAQRKGRPGQARDYFRRAASYADKLSQGALAEMYWNGEGGARDPVSGYIWMDLAAERGAPSLLARREHYWSQMTQEERERAIREGLQVYAEYGDEVAKRRLERVLVSTRRQVTGSRVGWVGNLSICLDPSEDSCSAVVTGEQYYADRYWKPNEYWEWQDRILLTPRATGEVDVGPLETVRQQRASEDN